MLHRLNIGHRLALSFGLLLLILIITVAVALRGFQSFRASMQEVKHQNDQIILVKDAHAHVLQAMIHLEAMAATSDPVKQGRNFKAIQDQEKTCLAEVDVLKSLATTHETLRQLALLSATLARIQESSLGVLDLIHRGKPAEAAQSFLAQTSPRIDELNSRFEALGQRRLDRLNKAMAQAEHGIGQNTLAILAAGLLAAGAAVFLGYRITRSITQPVRGFMKVLDALAKGNLTVQAEVDSQDEIGHLGTRLNQTIAILRGTLKEVSLASCTVASGASQLSVASEQMATTTRAIARSGERLHSVASQVAVTLGQFMASVEQVAGNVKISIGHTELAVSATQAGSKGSRAADESMAQIQRATGQIASVIEVIENLAQQSNRLSLNATIEAAKAGVHGKGFHVVAAEVGKLAEESRQATKEMDQLVQGTRAAVTGGFSSAQTISKLMSLIQASIANVSSCVREIGSATKEHAGAGGEIGRRMEESVLEVRQNAMATQELSATVQEIAHTALELATASKGMALAVAKFQI